VFASDRGLYVVNTDGSASRRLTRNEHDADPEWSPDAKRIAFSRIEVDEELLVMNADGSARRRVGRGRHPSWSPDGSKIAFSAASRSIAVVNSDGTRTRRVADRSDFGFAWSPDGKKIAYSDGGDPSRIHVVDVTSGASTALGASSFWDASDLDWSPDGTTIAFNSNGELVLIDAETGRVTKLTDVDPDLAPVWSPDSARIAFIRYGGLFTIGRDGRGERRLTSVGSPFGGGRAASWCSDGRVLVYERERVPGQWETDIWRVRADGTGARPITRAFTTGASYTTPRCDAAAVTSPPRKTAPTISLRPSRILRTPTAVVDLAADRGRVALATAGEFGCGPVGIWARRETATWLPASADCGDADGISGLVLAGTRAAWMYEVETNQLHYTALITGSAGSRARALRIADHDEEVYLGNLAGDGSLLVYNTWREPRRSAFITEPKLWRIVESGRARTRRLLARWDAIDVVSVDNGRLALLRPDGTLAILNDRLRKLSAFRLGWKGVRRVTLAGSQVIVLRGRTLEVRSAARGTVKRRWRPARTDGPITLEDAHGNFAVYTAGIAIHVLRLSDGRDRVLAIAKQAGPAHAELEAEGLYYAYNETGSAQPGRVAFVPFRELTSRFR
jgi:Tol biopolymer transport system component